MKMLKTSCAQEDLIEENVMTEFEQAVKTAAETAVLKIIAEDSRKRCAVSPRPVEK